jgi:anti-sigma-K factor RskA
VPVEWGGILAGESGGGLRLNGVGPLVFLSRENEMTTNCEHLRDSYELFVFGTLDGPEREEIAAHLGRGCPVCGVGVSRARLLATHLGVAAPPADPPVHLRAHVMRAVVQATPRMHSFWESIIWRMAFPVSAVAVLTLLLVLFGLGREIGSLNLELKTLQKSFTDSRKREQVLLTRANSYRAALALMSARESRVVRFGPKQPDGRVYLNPQGLVLIAAHFPQPPSGRTYELWLLRKSRKAPEPAGVFDPDSSGGAMHVLLRNLNWQDVQSVAVSDEPPGGVPSRTGGIVLVVPVSGMTR